MIPLPRLKSSQQLVTPNIQKDGARLPTGNSPSVPPVPVFRVPSALRLGPGNTPDSRLPSARGATDLLVPSARGPGLNFASISSARRASLTGNIDMRLASGRQKNDPFDARQPDPVVSSSSLNDPPSSARFIEALGTFVQQRGRRRDSSSINLLEGVQGVETHTILIRIVSNHGHPSLVSLSEIDVMADSKVVVPISKVEVVGDRKQSPLLVRLTDREFIKKDDALIWKHSWPPTPPAASLDILLTVDTTATLDCLRIWPDSVDPTRSVKTIQVYVDEKRLYHGDVESSFGSMIGLTEVAGPELLPDVKALLDSKKSPYEKKLMDEYGWVFPILEFSSIEFQVLDVFAGVHQFALSMIRLYYVDGQLLSFEPDRVRFEAHNCGQCADLSRLFSRRSTDLDESFIPWSGTTTSGIPRIVARFDEPVKVVAIEIVNSDITHTEEDMAVERMQVLVDSRSLWVGKLNRRTPVSQERRPNSTFVFTVCSEEVRRLVIGEP
jgi:hypothetical protein